MRAVLLLLVLALPWLTAAQGGKTGYQVFERIPVRIDAPVVNDIVQDTTGLVWLGTNKGLYAYDGFTVYACNGPDKAVQIQCSVLSGDSLWLGTDSGILLYDIRTGKYREHPLDGRTEGVVRSICCHDGKVYAGHASGIACYDTGSGEITGIRVTDSRGGNMAVYVLAAVEGRIYCGTFDGLYLLEGDTVRKLNGNQKDIFVYSICPDAKRRCIWLGTQKGLWKYGPGDSCPVAVEEIRHSVINDIIIDRDSSLVIGSDAGLYIYDGATIRHVGHDARDRSSLSDNDVESLLVDRSGNTWAGTHDGVSVAVYSDIEEFMPLSSFTGNGRGMPISSMIVLGNGSGLWCGGSNGIVYIAGEGQGRSRTFDIYDRRNPLPHNSVHSMFRDPRNGDIWAASDGGVLYYDRRKGVFRKTGPGIEDWNAEWCHDVAVDGSGKVWVGTFSSGVLKYDRAALLGGKDVAPERIFVDSTGAGQVRRVLPDSSGALWVLYYNIPGIGRIVPGKDSLMMFDVAGYIGEDTVPQCMICDGRWNVWVGYDRGLLCIDTRTLAVTQVPFPEWSTGAEVLGMAVSDRDMWLTTSAGDVWQVSLSGKTLHKLPLVSRRYTSIGYDPYADALFLGASDGFYKVRLPVNRTAYPSRRAYFMTAEINGKAYSAGSTEGGPGINLRFMRNMELGPDDNAFSVSFASMNFTSPELDQYAYRLDPVSDSWEPLKTGVNTISFVSLIPGKYSLSVCLLDEKGEPSPGTASTLGIRVRPPWLLSPVAFVIYLLVIAVVVVWSRHYSRIRERLKTVSFERELLMEQASVKAEFLTGISHDLRTPLSLIIGPLGRILMMPGNDGIRKQLEVMMKNAERLNTLLGRMLDYKNAGSGDHVPARSVIDLSDLVRNLVSRYMPEASSRKIRISFNCQSTHVFYSCDSQKLESVVDNLVSNAMKYTPDDGSIYISLYVDGYSGKLYLTVTDSGIGIPESDLPYIFYRFYQSSATRGKIKGTGLGLYMVKKYVEEHGGSVSVSSGEGKGTSFIVELPPEARHNTGPAEDAAKERPYTILVVEDNEDLSSFMSDLFSDLACVYTAWNGRDGLTLFRRIRPDLVIADMMMPIMDGMEFCRKVRAEAEGAVVPLIMLTAKTDYLTEKESIEAGVDAFIPKPFNAEKLRLKVSALLGKSSRLRESVSAEPAPAPKEAHLMSADEKFLSEIVKIIEENISLPELNVSFLAEKAGVSTKQLSRKLKPLTGYSPVDYIKNIRIKRASLMLDQAHFTVSEVMYSVGFTDPSYFAKCFQREFGCTPSQYLKDRKR